MAKLYIKNLLLIFFITGALQTRAAYQLLASNQQRVMKLDEAFKKLQSEHEVNIMYDPTLTDGLQVDAKVLTAKGGTAVILATMLKEHGLTYKMLNGNTYAIVNDRSTAQILVTGKVVSAEDNAGIPGVTVLVKGEDAGTITDFDGNYSLEVASEASILVFSSIGFKTVEQQVGTSTTINITMESDIQQLSEVVITALGLESDQRELGYSVQNIDTDDILKSREANIASALSGKAAGVQVISASGSPGASATVRIRGSRSMGGNNEPLYVIDGVPIDNNTSGNGIVGVDVSNRAIDINPNDIEKITILKGPAATVLYGSRGANGAIMINTKRGKTGAPTITINSSYGINEVNKLPEMQTQYAQGRFSGGASVYRGPETGETQSYGPLISELEFDGDPAYSYDRNGRLVPKGTGNGMPAKAYDPNDIFWVKGTNIDNNVSVTGGTDAARYYFSVGHLYQSGVVPLADFSRTSIKSNIDASLTERLKAGVSATYVHSGGNRALRGSNLSGVTTGVFRNTPTYDIGNGKRGYAAADDPSSHMYADGEQRSFTNSYDNPFWSINRNPHEDHVNRIMGNVNLSYKLWDWLTASYKLGLDQYTDRRKQAWDINSSSEPSGKVIQSTIYSNVINSDLLLLVNKDISDFGIDATLGHNYYAKDQFSRSSEGSIMAVQGYYHISNTQEVMSAENYIWRSRYYGVFADLRLNFREFIFLTLAGRNDWASTLPKSNNSFFYPSASIGFEFTDILGLTDSRIFPYGKLRASVGRVGKEADPFVTDNYYGSASIDGDGLLSPNQFPAFGVNGFERSSQLGNGTLIHELTTTVEVGGDFQFFDGRVDVDVTVYKSFTDDQLTPTTISGASGFTTITLNAGRVENKGIEIMLNTSLLRSRNLLWDLDIVFSHNESLIKSLPGDIDAISLASFSAISSVNKVGYPYGALSGTRYLRNDAGEMIIGSDGWPLFNDTQGIIGDPNPDWLAGVKNSFTAYGFSLSMLWDIRKGGDVWNGTKGFMDYLGTSKESADLRDVTGYVFEGVTASGEPNTVPVDFANPERGIIKWRRAGSNLGLAEDNIEDASWVRLREITLSYNLAPKIISQSKSFQSLGISVYGRNLLLFTAYKGVDPETNLRGPSNAQGWDYFNLPGSKSYGVSLKMVLK